MIVLSRTLVHLATTAAFVILGNASISAAQVDVSPTAAPEAPMCMNFSDLDFTLNGDATWSTDCRLELTSENPMKSGSAFAAITFDDTEKYPFEAYYEYDISDTIINGTSVGGSADGIAFLVHIDPQGVNALNDAGGAIGVYGAGGIHCAVVIELDTYFGPTNVGPHAPFSTENYVRALDIIATDEAGKATRYAEVDITDIFSMQGKVWISHNNGVLDVYLATQTAISRPLDPIVSVNMPIPALLLSRDEVYIGFSSSTGGEYDRHEVVFCSFEEAYTPEPTLTPTNKPTLTPTNKPVALPSAPLPSPSDKPTLSPTVDFPKRPKPPVTVPIKPTLQPSTVPVVPPTSINIVPPKAVERCDEDYDESKTGKGKGGSKGGKGKGGTNYSSSSRTVGKGGSFSGSGKGGSKGSGCDTNSESKGNDDSKGNSKGNSKGKAGAKSGKRGRGKASKMQARPESTKVSAKKGKRQLANTDSPTKKKKKTSHKKKNKAAHNKNKKKKASRKRKKATTTRTATSESGKRQPMADDLIYYK